jgi:2-iminobutanoate/2-iminopropanoate deaminase
MSITPVSTKSAPQAIGPYSQATIANGLVFASGQLGIDPATGDFVSEDVAKQTAQALENLKAVLEAANSGMDKVIKTSIFLKDLNDFATVNEIYASFFETPYPARACVEVAKLPKDGKVEIEAIAAL